MDAAALRARHRFDTTLKSGLNVSLELPNMVDCLIAVNAVGILEYLSDPKRQENGGKSREATLEDIRETREANVEMIRRAVKALDGEDVELSAEDVRIGFTEEEQSELLEFINRKRSAPLAASPT